MQNEWPATEIVTHKLSQLKPYEANPKTHPPEQIEQIKASIIEFGWTIPILIDEDGTILAGHGRLEAAKELGFIEGPCIVARGWSESQKRAYVIADNKLTENGGWDSTRLRIELQRLDTDGFSLSLTGFSKLEIGSLFKGESEPYSRKIEAPVYEPKGEKPKIKEMMDRRATDKMIRAIDKAKGLPDDVRDFLRAAAERHTRFNFVNIAEFYAHADKVTQRLMEDSALVVIDFDRAVELGFVKVSKAMGKLADKDKKTAEDEA